MGTVKIFYVLMANISNCKVKPHEAITRTKFKISTYNAGHVIFFTNMLKTGDNIKNMRMIQIKEISVII